MPHCCVPLCKNRSESKTAVQLSFYRFPKNETERKKWLRLIRRVNFTPTCNSRVCSWHFPHGKAAGPLRFVWNDGKSFQFPSHLRYKATWRKPMIPPGGEDEGCSLDLTLTVSDQTSISSPACPPHPDLRSLSTQLKESVRGRGRAATADDKKAVHDGSGLRGDVTPRNKDCVRLDHDYCRTVRAQRVQDKMVQCDEVGYFLLRNDADALLYTGLALQTFDILASLLEEHASDSFTICVRDQTLLTLMKLKTNHEMSDLSRRFHVSQSTAGSIISFWIDKLDDILRPLVQWLPRETIQAAMPAAFKRDFPKAACIVDCFETLLQKRQSHNPAGDSCSYYHSHNVVRYLVAAAPCGLIMFISAAYGERCSDKFITANSGLLDHLVAGDQVMAERGFNIGGLLCDREVKLVMASFTKMLGQLNEEQVTCRPAHVGGHAERAFRCLKGYSILSQAVSCSLAPKIDKILRICAALVNLREDLNHESD